MKAFKLESLVAILVVGSCGSLVAETFMNNVSEKVSITIMNHDDTVEIKKFSLAAAGKKSIDLALKAPQGFVVKAMPKTCDAKAVVTRGRELACDQCGGDHGGGKDDDRRNRSKLNSCKVATLKVTAQEMNKENLFLIEESDSKKPGKGVKIKMAKKK